MVSLYVVTDEGLSNGLSHTQIAEICCRGGADIIQLRDKETDDVTFLRYAREIRRICEKFGTTFIVNDRFDIALECCSDGVHLGQSDMGIGDARSKSPAGFILGCSVGNVEEAMKAERDGADYVALSPVFDTKSKADATPGHGLEMLSRIKSAVNIPVYAIGGINMENAKSVVEAGADGICVISAVVSQDDPRSATESLKRIITY
jgi:thiamine-phosphate pyrophosphorylase